MLQALLPQVAEFGEQVEVWVIDNASPDETQAVVEESRVLGPFQYCRNESNIGPLLNVLKGPSELAEGEFVWVLGDHNLIRSGALGRILKGVSANSSVDVLYSNFRCAVYPDQWPADALAGYNGPFQCLGNLRTDDGPVQRWRDLVGPENSFCTQVYAHVVRTQIWRDYWRSFALDQPYLNAQTTYPHTKMIVVRLFDAPSHYLGEPAITIFNGAQSWGNPVTQCAVFLNGLRDLVNEFGRRGVDAAIISEWKRGFCTVETSRVLSSAIRSLGVCSVFMKVIRASPFELYLWQAFWIGFCQSDCNFLARQVVRASNAVRGYPKWWIFNCRPVRWVRRILN